MSQPGNGEELPLSILRLDIASQCISRLDDDYKRVLDATQRDGDAASHAVAEDATTGMFTDASDRFAHVTDEPQESGYAQLAYESNDDDESSGSDESTVSHLYCEDDKQEGDAPIELNWAADNGETAEDGADTWEADFRSMEPMKAERVQTIKSAMSGFSLIAPPWASVVPEQDWIDRLRLNKLRPNN